MATDQSSIDDITDFAKLEPREFKSTIPTHILEKSTEQEKYILNCLSRGEQCFDWLVEAAVKNNTLILDSNYRISVLEKWKSALASKWSASVAIFIAVGGLVSTFSAGFAAYDRMHGKPPQQVIIRQVDANTETSIDTTVAIPSNSNVVTIPKVASTSSQVPGNKASKSRP